MIKALILAATGLLAAGVTAAPAPPEPAPTDAPRWAVTTESDGIGKVASVKSSNPKNFAILRCNKAGKASFMLGLDKVKIVDNLPAKLSGPTTGFSYDAMLRYRADARIWSTTAAPELIALLSGKDTQIAITPNGYAATTLSLAGSTKAIGDAMARCSQQATPVTETGVRSFVNNGYAFYYRPMGSEVDGFGDFEFSPELKTLIDKAAANDPSFPGVDAFCRCQDFDEAKFRHQIANVTLIGNRATVKVYVAPFGGPLTGDPVVIEAMRLSSGKWVVDDVDGLKAEARIYAEQ